MLSWLEAAEKVLLEAKCALHYTEISKLILEKNYLTTDSPTPHQTINSILNTDINKNKDKSKFVKVGSGEYILRIFVDDNNQLLIDSTTGINTASKTKSQKDATGEYENRIINAYGIYWNRNLVDWEKTLPDLLGIQQIGASNVNFKEQKGIYLLHDNREIIYVGQAIGQSLGQRLRQHISDRLSGRWDRFSWFGFYPVKENGDLEIKQIFSSLSIQNLGDVLEAILIESIEPRQNRKQGNTLFGLEYLQQEAPEIKKRKSQEILRELQAKL